MALSELNVFEKTGAKTRKEIMGTIIKKRKPASLTVFAIFSLYAGLFF
jgi:hypothetical protein